MNTTITRTDIDTLGDLLAQIDALTKRADEIKNTIKEQASLSGEKQFDGAQFRATYIESNRSTIDWKSIAKKLSIPEAIIVAHTKTAAVYSVKVTSR
jgi:hypothetical protein